MTLLTPDASPPTRFHVIDIRTNTGFLRRTHVSIYLAKVKLTFLGVDVQPAGKREANWGEIRRVQ